MVEILEIRYNPGSTWAKKIEVEFAKYPLIKDTPQKQDLIIVFKHKTGITLKVAIELKYQDLHNSMWGKGKGGNLQAELLESYLPYWLDGTFHEIWVFVVGPNDQPFANQVKTMKEEMGTWNIDPLVKSCENCHNGPATGGCVIDACLNYDAWEPKINIITLQDFAQNFDDLIDFIKHQAAQFRLEESLFKLCARLRIPVVICESQEKCLATILEFVQDSAEGKKTSDPYYVNDGKMSQMEGMLRAYKGMSEAQINVLNEMVYSIHEYDFPWSMAGIAQLLKDYGDNLRKINAFWQKFVDFWRTGKDPIPLKEIKDRLKLNSSEEKYYCHKDGGKAPISKCLKCPELDEDGHCDYRGTNKPEEVK